MGVRMIGRDVAGAGDMVALYDSVSGWAFGPVFDCDEDAEAFLGFLAQDARAYTQPELAERYGAFLEWRRKDGEG